MLQRIPGVPEGIDAFTVAGTLTADDYEPTVEPLLDEARHQDRRLRLLLRIGPEFEGFTAGAMWGRRRRGGTTRTCCAGSRATRS